MSSRLTTYSKRQPVVKTSSSLNENQENKNNINYIDASLSQAKTKMERVDMILSSLGSRLKRLSIVPGRKSSFIVASANGLEDRAIGKNQLDALQSSQTRKSFDDWLNEKLTQGWSFEKLGESTFSEVFLATKINKDRMVIKVVPLLEDGLSEQEEDSEEAPTPVSIEAAFHEISSLQAISSKVASANRYAVPSEWTGFANLQEFAIVTGSVPRLLVKEWEKWASLKKTENNHPNKWKFQRCALICMDFGGEPLEGKLATLTLPQLVSVVKQIAASMAILERELNFEHRDLHLGNILIKETLLEYLEPPNHPSIDTAGIQCSIIDCSIARFTLNGKDYYRDLEQEEWIFAGDSEVDEQYDVYRQMRTQVNQNWQPFTPSTNILWLRYLVVGMVKSVTGAGRRGARPDKSILQELINLKDRLVEYQDCRTFVKNDKFFK